VAPWAVPLCTNQKEEFTMSNVVAIRKNAATLKKAENKTYEEMTDAELVVACQSGDTRAMDALLNRHRKTAEMMLRKLAPDWKDTNDLVQEVMIRVWKSVGSLRNPQSFMGWLKQIVNNIFCDELRRRPKPGQFIYLDEPVTTDAGSELGPREIADERAQPDEDMLKGELSVVVMNAYKKIPADFRKAAMLRDIEGLSYEEIAVITNAELGTVKSRISRARAKMQRCISPYLRESA
jgi:RNA polymerase sigma-70 factor (ECF subfamily)